MNKEDLLELIADVQRHQCELEDVEVKAARRGTPQQIWKSLSAFANRVGGGTLLFGLDEQSDFAVVGVGNAHQLQTDISELAAQMQPPLRPEFTVEVIEDVTVVVVEVSGIPAEQRPCYYTPNGLQKGSYIRVGITHRVMSDYELFGYVSARNQTKFDEEPVADATLADLNRDQLDAYLGALRRARPQATFLNQPFEQVLQQLRLARNVDGVLRPALAALLMFGMYPQAHEPQLVITFLHYYGTTETEKTPRGERFLDNRKFEGPIPEVLEQAINHVLASIRKSSLIEGLYRRDIPEYPVEAMREAVINAVAHRDYSHFVRGSYIQIRLFADRIEVQSPGGLYGNVTEDTLEEEQSTRNRLLIRMMEDLHIVENRGSGIRVMIEAMRHANLEPPRFQDKRTSFWVTFRNHTLMSPDSIMWLNQHANLPLNDRQRLALVYLRLNDQLTNSDYRRLNFVDSAAATKDLRTLVQLELIVQHQRNRWTHYTLNIRKELVIAPPPQTDEEKIVDFVRVHGSITNTECRVLLGIDAARAYYLLSTLSEHGALRREGQNRWARYFLT